MSVAALHADGVEWRAGAPLSKESPGTLGDLLEFGVLAIRAEGFEPMDQALLRLGAELLVESRLHAHWTLAREYGLSDQLRAVVRLTSRQRRARRCRGQGRARGDRRPVVYRAALHACHLLPVPAPGA